MCTHNWYNICSFKFGSSKCSGCAVLQTHRFKIIFTVAIFYLGESKIGSVFLYTRYIKQHTNAVNAFWVRWEVRWGLKNIYIFDFNTCTKN